MKECTNNCGYNPQAEKTKDHNAAVKPEAKKEEIKPAVHAPVFRAYDSPDPDTFLFDVMERVTSR